VPVVLFTNCIHTSNPGRQDSSCSSHTTSHKLNDAPNIVTPTRMSTTGMRLSWPAPSTTGPRKRRGGWALLVATQCCWPLLLQEMKRPGLIFRGNEGSVIEGVTATAAAGALTAGRLLERINVGPASSLDFITLSLCAGSSWASMPRSVAHTYLPLNSARVSSFQSCKPAKGKDKIATGSRSGPVTELPAAPQPQLHILTSSRVSSPVALSTSRKSPSPDKYRIPTRPVVGPKTFSTLKSLQLFHHPDEHSNIKYPVDIVLINQL
jgi:hypothetical protein